MEKWNSTTFGPPPLEKSLWLHLEKPLLPSPLEKILPTPLLADSNVFIAGSFQTDFYFDIAPFRVRTNNNQKGLDWEETK